MGSNANPLIGESARETIENATEALNALVALLAPQHSGLCRLLGPIVAALEYEADRDQETATTTRQAHVTP